MGPEYAELMRQRKARGEAEAAEKLSEVQAKRRREVEGVMRRKAEEEDVALLRRLAAQKQKVRPLPTAAATAVVPSTAAASALIPCAAMLQAPSSPLSPRDRRTTPSEPSPNPNQDDAEAKVEAARQEASARAGAEEAARLAAEATAKAAAEAEAAERARQAESFKAQGNALFKSGSFVDAVTAYSQALEIDDANSIFLGNDGRSVLFSNRSGAFASLANYEQALADAERCVALRPDWAKGHTRKASALHGLARFTLAIDAYNAALAVEPGNETLLSGRRQSSFALAVESD